MDEVPLLPRACVVHVSAGDAKIMNRPSEFGYGLSIDEPAGGPWAREHAAAIAQSILLLCSDPSVDKFFLFSGGCAWFYLCCSLLE